MKVKNKMREGTLNETTYKAYNFFNSSLYFHVNSFYFSFDLKYHYFDVTDSTFHKTYLYYVRDATLYF